MRLYNGLLMAALGLSSLMVMPISAVAQDEQGRDEGAMQRPERGGGEYRGREGDREQYGRPGRDGGGFQLRIRIGGYDRDAGRREMERLHREEDRILDNIRRLECRLDDLRRDRRHAEECRDWRQARRIEERMDETRRDLDRERCRLDEVRDRMRRCRDRDRGDWDRRR